MPARDLKHFSRLSNEREVSDEEFDAIVNDAAAILKQMSLDGNADAEKGLESSKSSLLVAAVVLDSVRRGKSGEDFLSDSCCSEWSEARKDALVQKLYVPFSARWKSGPAASSCRFPQFVDVDWRLDVGIKDSNVEKANDLQFTLDLTTVSHNTPSTKKVVCSVEELESLVHSVKEAIACLKSNSA